MSPQGQVKALNKLNIWGFGWKTQFATVDKIFFDRHQSTIQTLFNNL